ncbi:hypothetical protein B9Z55_019818 [Caenorhabditis nigoni]|uniref:Uncharacterized protein n=1 Tax=Caenorhabditis nigoni TaxID=1611254 RepID=A0A2G5TKI0_9PELO|nr:hypothetical protein B9Z55_019818 [Caenorhabditis nigoni]
MWLSRLVLIFCLISMVSTRRCPSACLTECYSRGTTCYFFDNFDGHCRCYCPYRSFDAISYNVISTCSYFL